MIDYLSFIVFPASAGMNREDGTTLEVFRRDFEALVARHGWSGWTGEGSAAGRAWRTRVIYAANLRTSHAAGRYAQLQEVKSARPYWRYRHNDSVLHPRPQHQEWDGMILLADDPWWRKHYTPNGWGCHCWVESLALRDLEQLGIDPAGLKAPEAPIDAKTGEPIGIDKGWGYAPGANAATPLRELIDRKLFDLEAPIGAAMWDALKGAVAMETRLAVSEMVERIDAAMLASGESLLVTAVAPEIARRLREELEIELQSAGIWLRDRELLHALRDSKSEGGRALPVAVWRDLPRLLETARVYFDTEDPSLIYAFDAIDGAGKVVIRVNYSQKTRQGGRRERIKANFVRTGGIVESHNLDEAKYKKLGR